MGTHRFLYVAAALAGTVGVGAGVGCSPRARLGSDIIWVSELEGGTFAEWTEQPGGAVGGSGAPNLVEVTTERAHHGRHAAKLTIANTTRDLQVNTGLVRKGNLPQAAYYSAWYLVPTTVTVGTFWTVFKLRRRMVQDDPTTEAELYDADIRSQPNGDMTFYVYDHRVAGPIPLQISDVVVPVGRWFQIEAYYRNAQDSAGRATFWFDGVQVVDVQGMSMGPTPWVEWDVTNVGENLSPIPVSLYIDDAAISGSRVGVDGVLDD